MKSAAIVLGLLTCFISQGVKAEPPAQSGTFLVIVDDLNVEFRATPRLREMTDSLSRRLVRDAARGAFATTTSPGAIVPVTADLTEFEAANRRLVAQGLKLSEILAAQQRPELGLEVRHRAATALEAAASAISQIAPGQGGRFAVIYISSGDSAGDLPERMALVQAAVRAGAAVHVIDPRGSLNLPPPQGVSQADWDAHIKATRASLAALADQTKGTMSLAPADVDSLLNRLM